MRVVEDRRGAEGGVDPVLLERVAEAVGAVAVRWQEFADAAAAGWAGAFVGVAAQAYADQVEAPGRVAGQRAQDLRRVAQGWWVAADLVRAGGPMDLGGVDEVTRRDLVARSAVDADLVAGLTREADGLLGRGEATTWRNARAVAAAVGQREAVLWAYDPEAHGGDGEVVIGVGDVGAAGVGERPTDRPRDHVVLVPGVGTDVSDAPQQVGRVEDVVAAARAQGAAATVGWWWLGHDLPDGPTDPAMVSTARAEAGGRALAGDVAQLQAAHATGSGARWVLAGHSYGATTVAEAAAGVGVDADAVVLLGAPGAGSAREADDLGVERVFVGRDSRDVVAALGEEGWVAGPGLGRDPAGEEFGAVRFSAERAEPRGWWGWGEAHSGYFTPGSESLDNLGAVVAGAYDRVEVAAPVRDPWWGRPRDPEWGRAAG